MRITKVHRNGQVFYAAQVGSVYLERQTEADLIEAIAVRDNFRKIFADGVANDVKPGYNGTMPETVYREMNAV